MAEVVAFLSNSLTITVLVAYIFALWAALVVWAWFDVSSRTDNSLYRLGAILMVATGALLGFAIYILLRPNLTKEEVQLREIEEALLTSQATLNICPSCHTSAKEDFEYCSSCSFKLSVACQNCDRKTSVAWSTCPYCGAKREIPVELPKEAQKEEVAFAESKSPKIRRLVTLAFLSSIFNYVKSRQSGKRTIKKAKTAKAAASDASRGKKRKSSRASRKRSS